MLLCVYTRKKDYVIFRYYFQITTNASLKLMTVVMISSLPRVKIRMEVSLAVAALAMWAMAGIVQVLNLSCVTEQRHYLLVVKYFHG